MSRKYQTFRLSASRLTLHLAFSFNSPSIFFYKLFPIILVVSYLFHPFNNFARFIFLTD